jgi:hypothetical protein
MKTLVMLAVACAWCFGAELAVAQQGSPSPQIVEGSLGCDEDCVDVYEIRCTQSSHRIQAVVSDTGCGDHFQATLIGYSPASIVGVADAATTPSDAPCNAEGVVVVKAGAAAALRALLSIHSFSSANRNYSLEVACFSGPDPGNPVPRNMSLQLVTDQ